MSDLDDPQVICNIVEAELAVLDDQLTRFQQLSARKTQIQTNLYQLDLQLRQLDEAASLSQLIQHDIVVCNEYIHMLNQYKSNPRKRFFIIYLILPLCHIFT